MAPSPEVGYENMRRPLWLAPLIIPLAPEEVYPIGASGL